MTRSWSAPARRRRRSRADLPAARPCRALAGTDRARFQGAPCADIEARHDGAAGAGLARLHVRRAGGAREALQERGVEIVEVAAGGDGRVDVAAAAQALGARGLTRVLVEGGGQVAAAFLKAGPGRPHQQLPGGPRAGRRRPLCGRAFGVQPARFRAPVQAGFGAFAGRRHAGNLGQRDLSTSMFTGIVTDIGEITSVTPGGKRTTAASSCAPGTTWRRSPSAPRSPARAAA